MKRKRRSRLRFSRSRAPQGGSSVHSGSLNPELNAPSLSPNIYGADDDVTDPLQAENLNTRNHDVWSPPRTSPPRLQLGLPLRDLFSVEEIEEDGMQEDLNFHGQFSIYSRAMYSDERDTEMFEDEPSDGDEHNVLQIAGAVMTESPEALEHFLSMECLSNSDRQTSQDVDLDGSVSAGDRAHGAHSRLENQVDVTESSSVTLRITNWRVLWGLLVTNGSLKMTKGQYQAMRIIADSCRRMFQKSSEGAVDHDLPRQRIDILPHYNSLFKTHKPLLYDHLSVRGNKYMEKVDIRKAGARARQYSETGSPLVPVHTILPSEYAREDVACEPVFNLMRSTSLHANNRSNDCIDTWPIISARPWFYGPRTYLTVDGSDCDSASHSFAEAGDILAIDVMGSRSFHEELKEKFVQCGNTIKGEIIHIWTAHHEKRRADAEFFSRIPSTICERDTNIILQLQHSSYTSPSDAVSVNIPELPVEQDEVCHEAADSTCVPGITQRRKTVSPGMREALNLRKKAQQEYRRQMEQAWLGWSKPLVKPGDLITLIRPAHASNDSTSRILIVCRFWTEREERGRHVFWLRGPDFVQCTTDPAAPLSGFTPLGQSESNLYRDVRSIRLTARHSGKRGPDRFDPISSHGFLESGERYFIYRFLLFWDGFEISVGKSASGEGVYLVCLNLPPFARSSASAVRILSLTPPGVKSEVIFQRIQDDIAQGQVEGVVDFDAYGNRTRIFLDLVGCIGDTPAINAALDVLGHTGSACCHLCRFVRKSNTRMGSRYTRNGFNGFSSSTGRGFYQHCGVRDSSAKEETCRLLGMTPTRPNDKLQLHTLRSAVLASRGSIPATRGGVPILYGDLDPYRACLIAPDHLLTGHFRDCVNTAFRLLPSKQHRVVTEQYMIGLLCECDLPIQNRLFDFEKKALFSMSMSELYSLSMIAHTGFLLSCRFLSTLPAKVSDRCKHSIEVMRSCADLIAHLWNPVRSMEVHEDNSSFVTSIQNETNIHIDRVRELCTMEDSDLQALESTRTSRSRRAELSKEYRDRAIAVKTIDKPNVHRLRELAFSTLPMVGFVSRVGELVLEKTHQTLKRAIKHSNNKDVQIQSVLSSIFGDWQARLSMQANSALKGDINHVRGCFRLLAGREAVFQLEGRISSTHEVMVQRALGPACCVPVLLTTQSKSVLSPRATMYQSLRWHLETNIEVVHGSNVPSTSNRAHVFHAFGNLCMLLGWDQSIQFGDSVRSVYVNGATDLTFEVGHVLQVQCYQSTSLSSHYPIVAQRKASISARQNAGDVGVLCWGILALFKRKDETANTECWAAVNPCLPEVQMESIGGITIERRRFTYGNTISFLTIDSEIRRAALIPLCSTECKASSMKAGIDHSQGCNPSSGTPFLLFTKSEGYPPRTG